VSSWKDTTSLKEYLKRNAGSGSAVLAKKGKKQGAESSATPRRDG
jgi:hypothetical protein